VPEYLEIEGDLVRRVQREVIAENRLEDLLPHLERRVPVITPTLPDGAKAVYYSEDNPANKIFEVLVEMAPRVRTLPIGRRDAELHPTVALPYTIFHFRLHTGAEATRIDSWAFDIYHAYHARESADNLDQEVVAAMLPNVFAEGNICFGDTARPPATRSMAKRINQIVNDFYISDFSPTGHHRPHHLPWGSNDFTRWVEESRNNRQCWQNWPEWDNTTEEYRRQRHYILRDRFATGFEKVEIIPEDGIPELPMRMTFGQANEWLQTLENHQRSRLLQEMQVLQTEAPALFENTPVARER